jgi:hypothetical protein
MSTEHGRHGSVLGETGETKGSGRRTTWAEAKRRPPSSDLARGLPRGPGAAGSTPPEVGGGSYTLDAPGPDRGGVLVAVSSEDPAAVAQWVDQFDDEGEGGGAVSCQKGSGCTLKCAVLAIQLRRAGSGPAGARSAPTFETDLSDGSLSNYIDPVDLTNETCPSSACLFLLARLRPNPDAPPPGGRRQGSGS